MEQSIYLKAYDIYSRSFLKIVYLSLIFFLPIAIIRYFGQGYFQIFYTRELEMYGFNFKESLIYTSFLVSILKIIFVSVFMSGIFLITLSSISEEELKFSTIYINILKKSPLIILGAILYKVAITVLIPIFLLIPYVGTVFYFFMFEIVVNNNSLKNAFVNSRLAVKNNWISTLFFLIGVILLGNFSISIFYSLIGKMNMPVNILFQLIYGVLEGIFISYFYILISLWYVFRKQNFKQNIVIAGEKL